MLRTFELQSAQFKIIRIWGRCDANFIIKNYGLSATHCTYNHTSVVRYLAILPSLSARTKRGIVPTAKDNAIIMDPCSRSHQFFLAWIGSNNSKCFRPHLIFHSPVTTTHSTMIKLFPFNMSIYYSYLKYMSLQNTSRYIMKSKNK